MWKHPYAAIDEIFLNALKRNNNDVNVAFDSMHEEDMLDNELTNVKFLDSIPYLTTSAIGSLQNGDLCRYRGLVQDMYGNELYVGSVMTSSDRSADREMHVTKYRDILPNEYFCDADSYNRNDSSENFKDRQSFLLVPIPGQAAWVREEQVGKFNIVKPSVNIHPTESGAPIASKKRSVEELNGDITSSFDNTATKQSTCGDQMDVDDKESNPGNENGNENDALTDNRSKNSKFSGISDELADDTYDTSDMFASFSKSCPDIYQNNDICCLAKMYNCSEGTFRLNDVIEIIGIYTTDPILTSVDSHGQGGNVPFEEMIDPLAGFDDDDSQSLPPPSVAPRIHCISFRKLGPCFPLLNPLHTKSSNTIKKGKKVMRNDNDNDDNCNKNISSMKTEYCKSPWALTIPSIDNDCGLPIPDLEIDDLNVKRWIVNRIKYALRGDELAAEYVTLAILSRLYNRDENETLLLGSLSLNLCGFHAGDERIKALKSVLEEFVPLCVQISADIHSLNSINMMPSRDSSKNRLSLSPLQLGNGTVLLIDETNLGTGQLNEKGTRSVSALQSIAMTQHLPMSYPYYELKVPTDLPIIIFTATSNGASLIGSEAFKIVLRDSPSLLPQDRQGDIEGKDEWEGVCSDVWRSRARLWWASVREKDVSMKEDLAVSGIESFANARQIDTRLTQSDFHRWLTVSRLLAISEGSQNINSIHWGTMRKMEGERLDRYFSI